METGQGGCCCLVTKSCLTLLQPCRFLCPWDFPGKKTGVGCHFLLQGNLPDPGVELVSYFGRRILYHLSRQGSPRPERWLSLKHQGTGIPSQLSALHPQGRQKITACTCQASGTGCGKDWDYEKESQFQVLRNGLGSSCFQLPVPGLGRWGGQCCLCRRVAGGPGELGRFSVRSLLC